MEKKILICEDDQFLREMYSEVVKAEGYQVDVAVDGEDALQKMQLGGWDLVLLDIIMPKLSGLEVMQRISQMPPLPQPNKSVVFLTNLDKGEEIKQALLFGNGYLIKSQITPGDLVNEVKLYLSQQAAPPQAPQPAAAPQAPVQQPPAAPQEVQGSQEEQTKM